MRTIVIEWHGPHSPHAIPEDLDSEGGLYLFVGKQKYQKHRRLQYCGITGTSFSNRFSQHHKLPVLSQECDVWLGKVRAPAEFEKKDLEFAEAVIVYFWQPELNERKKIQTPKPAVVVSHWHNSSGSPLTRQHSDIKNLPDVISWDGSAWRTANLKVYIAE